MELIKWPITARVDFFETRRYFSKIAGNSADTDANLLRTADAPLSENFSWELRLTVTIFQRWYSRHYPTKKPELFLILLQKKRTRTEIPVQFTDVEDAKDNNNASHDLTDSQLNFTEVSTNSRSAEPTRDSANGFATSSAQTGAPGRLIGEASTITVDKEEANRLIDEILDLQRTLDNLTPRMNSVKQENLVLSWTTKCWASKARLF